MNALSRSAMTVRASSPQPLLDPSEMVNPRNPRDYLAHPLSPEVASWPAMLGKEERILPAYLASKISGHDGAVVELGCYLGGSTAAILEGLGGLRADINPQVHSYDLFRANDYMLDHSLKNFGILSGDSFEGVFRSLLGDRIRHVAIHPGDILQAEWTGGEIKLLYVDMLWSWETNAHVMKTFYPHLGPGSWLIHQDYVYSAYPWLPITMEWLVSEGYFTFQYFAEYSTVAFRCEKSLGDPAAYSDARISLESDTMLELLQRSADRFTGYPRALLTLAKAHFLCAKGDKAAADEIAARVEKSASHPFVSHHLQMFSKPAPSLS
jgi:hypothetical protein